MDSKQMEAKETFKHVTKLSYAKESVHLMVLGSKILRENICVSYTHQMK